MAQPPDHANAEPQISNGDVSLHSLTAPVSLSNIPGLDEPPRAPPPASTMQNMPNHPPSMNIGTSSYVDGTEEVKNVWRSDLVPNAVVPTSGGSSFNFDLQPNPKQESMASPVDPSLRSDMTSQAPPGVLSPQQIQDALRHVNAEGERLKAMLNAYYPHVSRSASAPNAHGTKRARASSSSEISREGKRRCRHRRTITGTTVEDTVRRARLRRAARKYRPQQPDAPKPNSGSTSAPPPYIPPMQPHFNHIASRTPDSAIEPSLRPTFSWAPLPEPGFPHSQPPEDNAGPMPKYGHSLRHLLSQPPPQAEHSFHVSSPGQFHSHSISNQGNLSTSSTPQPLLPDPGPAPPSPGTTVYEGQNTKRGKLPKATTDHLKQWLHRHSDHPYPSVDEKKQLCVATGLSLSQVSNWMINARRRILAPARTSAPPVTMGNFPAPVHPMYGQGPPGQGPLG